MDKFLDELTIEDLKGETQELAETIGLDAFKRLVQARKLLDALEEDGEYLWATYCWPYLQPQMFHP